MPGDLAGEPLLERPFVPPTVNDRPITIPPFKAELKTQVLRFELIWPASLGIPENRDTFPGAPGA